MKRIGVALMAAAPLWAACSDSEVDWDSITALEGANGAQAALEWRNGLDFTSELQYPITVHWDIDIQLKDIPQPLGPAKDGFIVASLDTTLFGKNEFRTRCSIEMAAWGRDEFIIVHLDSNHEELRISHRGIDSIGPIEVPTGMVISADRLQLATDFLLRLVSNAPGFLAEELKVVSDFDGISDIFHPDNIARLLGPTTLQQGCTWRQSDERTQVTFAPLMALASSEATEVMPSDFSLSGFDQLFDLEITMEFDRVSGAFHGMDSAFHYVFDDLSANTKEQPSMMVTLHCEPRGTEVRALKFRENEEVLDLNEDFDEMWPLIVAMEPAILEAYRKVADDAAQSEDFSF